ncbi:MAG: hypothetical protein JW941_08010 [Candidatus Coatesbacteria bacterium]|nr:hypothetical protein [Candidatus Coatesbacteria bacterium]
MKRIMFAIVLLLVAATFSTVALAEDEETATAEKALKFKVGLKGFYGSWDFENSEVWVKGVKGNYDMTSEVGPFGPFVELSFAKDHLGLSAQYLVGRFGGDYHVRNDRNEGWYETKEKGTLEVKREDIELLLRLTPFPRYISLLFGYKWQKYYNFDFSGHGIWTEYDGGFDVPVGTHEYDMRHEERNRMHGFMYGLALESPTYSGFYAWANGVLMPNLNLKYDSYMRYDYDDPTIENNVVSGCFSGRLKSFKTELGLAYACEGTPLEFKVGWYLQRTKASEDKAKEAPIFNDNMTGAIFSVAYTF